ncbi:hypothetical protein GZ178_06940 [Dermatophilus congolensis]|nr:hypothetical protein [Dermatophilus congolensis]MBO3152187.1 hypothetical protein [Dermatophilus congolensis]MBO3160800.1 hypothetical protein [Dermatophilus congolensis]MBO3163475.1 hypothetical protein [Dermatophilus congolensis]MBO3183792.1 hypothetical protein [Dermatophilus congolensis]
MSIELGFYVWVGGGWGVGLGSGLVSIFLLRGGPCMFFLVEPESSGSAPIAQSAERLHGKEKV